MAINGHADDLLPATDHDALLAVMSGTSKLRDVAILSGSDATN
jgi:hypothetical protein